MSKNKLEPLLFLCYLALPFIFFKDSLNINSVILGTGDTTAIILPLRELITNLIKNGEMPFWNIFNFSGYPLLAYNEAGLFYPVTMILNLLFPVHLAHNLSILLHYSLAGIFMHLFLKEYKLNIFSIFTGSIIFMFSGITITHRSHPNILYTLVWLPLILFFLIKYRRSKDLNFLFICSIFYSISFFAGHAQIFVYLSFVVLIFITFYALIYEGKKGLFFLRALSIFIICILIVSIQLTPTIELMLNSTRSSISYEYFSSFSFDFKLIPILVFPYIYGNTFFQYQDVPSYFGPWNYNEMVIYFGVATIPLLIIGLFSKNKHKFLWIFILIISFILVLGDKTPIYKFFFHIPVYNKFRVPTRNWFEFGFSFSILSAFGMEYMVANSREKLTRNIVKVIILIFSSLLAITIFFVVKGKYLLKEKMVSELFRNLKITNYSIFVPLILIFLTVIILSLFLKYNKKILYVV
ncbi:MAG TPA: YfhO family protein, partial [Actinobacteria bacterium]|nr:YfhO family protein [Actinomycetota bacterium]